MKVRDIHILARKQLLALGLTEKQIPDDLTQKVYLSQVFRELAEKHPFSFLTVRLDPALTTVENQRNYSLPSDFPDNFLRHAGDRGEKHLCKLDKGTSESLLDYETPVTYFSRDQSAETAGEPVAYTIMALPSGNKEIWLAPKPDDNADSNYTISGLYIPTEWKVEDDNDLPLIPSTSVLIYGLLKLIQPGNKLWEDKHQLALNDLVLREARNHSSRLVRREDYYRSF